MFSEYSLNSARVRWLVNLAPKIIFRNWFSNVIQKLVSSSDPHLDTPGWHSFWHTIWECIWRKFWFWHFTRLWFSFFLTFFLTFYLASILTLFVAYMLQFFLAVYLGRNTAIWSLESAAKVRRRSLWSGGCCLGPARATAIKSLQLRFGGNHCDQELGVEVRRGPL